MAQLRDLLGSTGSIIAYNATFERNCLKDCARLRPEWTFWLETIAPRILDLLAPFRTFHYYHPDQGGSASLKAVLPVLVGQGYKNLAIQEGSMASREFLRLQSGQVTQAERKEIRANLEAYCARDTLGMVEILDRLNGLVRK